jgi:hypothetical protein
LRRCGVSDRVVETLTCRRRASLCGRSNPAEQERQIDPMKKQAKNESKGVSSRCFRRKRWRSFIHCPASSGSKRRSAIWSYRASAPTTRQPVISAARQAGQQAAVQALPATPIQPASSRLQAHIFRAMLSPFPAATGRASYRSRRHSTNHSGSNSAPLNRQPSGSGLGRGCRRGDPSGTTTPMPP